ncbi:MAG: flagellin FliC3 [Acetatifactor sp.]|nr:flagellin FliC3 [Acetatifactor sp.]
MRINYNVSAMLANNSLTNNEDFLSKSLERLSSGLKINHAKDNPAGLAMGKRMNAQLKGLSQAGQNASDGVSIIETADGALNEVSNMLQRMNELAVKSANGSLTDADRQTIQEEVDQLKKEIQRIADDTEFNGQKLLNGEFLPKGYTSDTAVKVNSYNTKVEVRSDYRIDNLSVSTGADGKYVIDSMSLSGGFSNDITGEMKDGLLVLTNTAGFEMKLDITDSLKAGGGSLNISDVGIDILGKGSMRLQIGSNEGQIIGVEIPGVNLRDMGIENVDVSTQDAAGQANADIKSAMAYVSSLRGQLGAYQNRLESTVNSLDITGENMTSAYSRIMDVDMAEEMTAYTTYQVLSQTGTSMLAQANERPSTVLQLLQ